MTDEREPGRLNFRDYLWLVKFGEGFNDADLGDRSVYLNTQFSTWYERGATEVSVIHMVSASMHGRLGAKPVEAKGIVFGVVDPVLAETLAGLGLMVVNLNQGILEPQSSPLGEALPAVIQTIADTIPGYAELPKAWLTTSPQSLEELAVIDTLIDPKAIVLMNEVQGKAKTVKTDAEVLAFYSADLSKESRAAMKAIVSPKPKFAYFPEFETALTALAPYEACARKAYAKEIFQGLHLHKRRIAARATLLNHLRDAMGVELELTGTDKPNPALIAEVGLRTDKTPKR
ncbi:MAG: hypothetical protein IPK97_07465 [Ahniella sp.]|nr:hypothetical protein [Ahniella sp.]